MTNVKLTIKGQEKKERPELKLCLRCGITGRINLHAEDNDGHLWCIFVIHPKGKFTRCWGLPKDIGLQVDSRGRIKEAK